MDRRSNNQYAMMLAVQQVLDDNNSVWNPITAFTQQKNELDALITAIAENREDAIDRSQGTTEEKNRLKRQVSEKAARLSGILRAYANINGSTELADEAGHSMSDYEDMRDIDFPDHVKKLTDLLREHETALVDYSITEAQITELETSTDDFRQMVGKPRLKRSSLSLANQKATDGVKDAMDLLHDKIDELMLIFKDSHLDFYTSYEDARVIVDN